ncbi:MAG: HupE/UreJ family protein [Brucellaceae bacterium]|nr:HupE/UreJ family protein [Brucellaceae bacterium]
MLKRLLTALPAALAATPAFAHVNPAEHGSFAAGFSHPLTGADHMLAMVAVGLWAALLGGRALWQVPAAFVCAMLAGFGAGIAGLPLPFVEPMILASVIIIGLVAATASRLPAAPAMAMVGFFAFFHGHAHGGEIGTAGVASFAAGFVIATALLHWLGVALGMGIGRLAGIDAGRSITRLAGAATALAGLWLVTGG